MAGTGNLLLKRGQTVPTDGALLRAMPAVQLIAPSPVVGTQAYVNYPNRLWVGMDDDGTLVPNQNNCTTGNFSYSNAEANSGTVGAIPGVIGPCNGTGATINNTRPIWMGAEIRAAVAVDDANNTGTPTILEADWAHPSDYILVTQKSIYDWANAAFAKGSGGGTVKLFENSDPTSTNFIELRAPDSPVTSYDLIYPAALPASAVGKALTIQSVDGSNNATLTWSDPGSAASASTVAIGNTVTAGTYYIPYTAATSGNGALNVDTSTLTYNPDTNTLTTSKVALNGSTSGTTTIQASATAGSTTITLPATTGTVVTTGDTGTVTSAMIADGTIVNGDISATAAIAVSKLSASTISGVTLGNNLNALTISTGLSGTSYNGSGAVTIAIDSTVATLTGLQNLTNKTLGSGSTWNGNLIGLQYGGTNKNFAASPPAAGSLVYFDADSMEALAPGAAGTVLYIPKGGTPTWTSTGLLDVGTAAEAGSAAAINNITDTTTANITYYPLFAANTIFSQTLRIDSSTLTYNPSTNTLTTGNLTASSAVSADTLSTTGNGTIGGNLTVTGNLTVNGTTTTLNTETLAVEDNIVVLNSNVTASPSLNAGLEVERGTSPNTSFLWNETTDRWSVNHTDTTQSAYEYPITISDSSSAVHSGPAEGGYSTTGDFVGQGSISGTTLSVSSISSGAIRIGQIITGTGVASGTKITGYISGSATSGGDWTVNNSQTVSSTTITGSAGAAGPQYIHSAFIKYLDVKNLNMSGSWILGATIASNFDLTAGGLVLPYVNGTYHNNAFAGQEGQIAYNTATNKAVIRIGTTSSNDATGASATQTLISTGNLTDITSVGTLGNTTISGTLSVTNSTDSTNSTSGSVILSGGVGIAKKLYVGTDLNVTSNTSLGGTLGVTGVSTFSDATDSSSSITGSAKFAGGVGIAKKLYVGTDLNVTSNTSLGGTLGVTGVSNLNGGIAVNTNAFTVATSTGNVSMTGSFTSTNATDSSNSSTGSVVLSGGIGIAKNLNVAGNVGITGTTTLGAALALNYTNPAITTNQTSGTLGLFNTGFLGTGNVLGVAQAINIGTSQTSGGLITIGSANTTLTSNGALTVTGTLTANGNITLGSDATDTIAVNGVITTNLVFEGSTADNFETTLAASNPAADITITMPAWGGTMVVPTGTATSTYLITSSGTSTQPSWTDPDNVVVGGVFVRRETTQDTTKYPIPFLGSSKENNPATTWGLLVPDGASQAAYLYTDMTNSGGSVGGGVTNSSSGLMYEVGNGVGTLYADYIGATLDCGTY